MNKKVGHDATSVSLPSGRQAQDAELRILLRAQVRGSDLGRRKIGAKQIVHRATGLIGHGQSNQFRVRANLITNRSCRLAAAFVEGFQNSACSRNFKRHCPTCRESGTIEVVVGRFSLRPQFLKLLSRGCGVLIATVQKAISDLDVNLLGLWQDDSELAQQFPRMMECAIVRPTYRGAQIGFRGTLRKPLGTSEEIAAGHSANSGQIK